LRFIFIHHFIKKNMNPSLLLIPDRYKAAKLYSQIPDSGAGDLTFARNSNATRVNSAGLIEKVRTNIALYSEQFNDASWQKINATVSANSTTAPNGTLTADKLIDNAVNSPHYVLSTNASTSNITTVSFFAKKAERNFALVFLNNTAATAAWFDLDSGTIGDKQAAVLSHSIVSAGNGWYRCTATFASISANDFCISVASANNVFSYVGDGVSGIFIWGAQLEAGDIATDYIPTTTAAVSVGITADIPRLDYTGGGCPSLLLEPQRTNLVTFSEQFNNAAWTKTNATISVNTAVSPDGYTNADKLINSATLAGHFLQQTISITGVHTFSVFAKASESSVITLQVQQVSVPANFGLIYYDLISGQVESGDFSTSLAAGAIQEMGNGWYRCTITYTPITAGNHNVRVFVAQNVSGNKIDYVGNGTDGVFVWGAQLEAGSYVSSYIPSLGASVTRLADAASKTGISSLIGQSEGVLFVDFIVNGRKENTNILGSERNITASFFIGALTDNTIDAGLYVSGFLAARITGGSVSVGQRAKIAYAYKSGSSALYINGALIGTSSGTFTLLSTIDDIFLNDVTTYFNYQENVSFNQVALFTTRLTNAELASITTL
jgi:hypothetical protein